MNAMTPRERFLTALTGGIPDRVPVFDFLYGQNLYQHVIGRRPAGYNMEDVLDLSLALELDAAVLFPGAPQGYQTTWLSEDTYLTEWGSTNQRNPAAWPLDAPVGFPVKTRADWDNLPRPDPYAQGRMQPIRDGLKRAAGRLAVLGAVTGPYTMGWVMTGMEGFSLLLYDDPALLRDILRVHTDYSIAMAQQMIALGIDGIVIGDDLAQNNGPLLSPAHFRTLILPLFVELVQSIRRTGTPVLLHCCGNTYDLLDDLARSGINGYNPLQRTAGMDLGRVKAAYGKQISLSGNVDSARTMPFGSREDVERETRECLAIGGPGGGYMLGSDHSLHDGIPVENSLAMIETGKRFGAYPF